MKYGEGKRGGGGGGGGGGVTLKAYILCKQVQFSLYKTRTGAGQKVSILSARTLWARM